MAKLPKKDYYRLSELAAEWGCAVEDIIHHFLHGRIRLGIRVHDELLYGMNADLHTIGAYHVSGVLTIPPSCAEAGWEFDPQGLARAGSLLIEPDYPPDITEASYIAEDSVPPAFWGWAPGRDWDNPETDHSRIERFGVGFTGIDESGSPIFDWRAVDPARLVVHAVERERLLRVDKAGSLGDQAAIQPQEAPPLSIAPASGDPDTTGMVAWKATVVESWTIITAKYGPRPSARHVLAWLKKYGPPDVFPPERQPPDRNSAVWLDTSRGSHILTLKNLGTRLSELRAAGKIPA